MKAEFTKNQLEMKTKIWQRGWKEAKEGNHPRCSVRIGDHNDPGDQATDEIFPLFDVPTDSFSVDDFPDSGGWFGSGCLNGEWKIMDLESAHC